MGGSDSRARGSLYYGPLWLCARHLTYLVYERNQEAVDSENKYIFRCMNTDRICLFTDTGVLHQVKVLDIPTGKLKDKETAH